MSIISGYVEVNNMRLTKSKTNTIKKVAGY
jgi:hypothetical protein